ncbi:hypothetical protein [Petrimonas sp.]
MKELPRSPRKGSMDKSHTQAMLLSFLDSLICIYTTFIVYWWTMARKN